MISPSVQYGTSRSAMFEVRVLCAVHLNALEGSIFGPCSGPAKQSFNRMKLKIASHLGVISKNSESLNSV